MRVAEQNESKEQLMPSDGDTQSGRHGARRIRRGFILALLGAVLVGWALYGCDRSEERIVAELDRISQGGEPGQYFAAFDYICISINPGLSSVEFAQVAASKSIPVGKSLECTIWSSCCNLSSESGGVVGLVKNGAIRCVELRGTAVLSEAKRSICTKPSALIVNRETITEPGQLIPGRSWTPRPGETYYKVMERHQ